MSKQPAVDKLQPVIEQMTDEDFKDWLYEVMDEAVKDKTGRRLTKPLARRLFLLLFELIFDRVIETGYFRLPGGHGSFTLKHLPDLKGYKRLPGHPEPVLVEAKGRARVKYTMGSTVREKLGIAPNGGYERRTKRISEVAEQRDIIERTLDDAAVPEATE